MKSTISLAFLFILICHSLLAQNLAPYECLEHFSLTGYTKQYDRNFDQRGIITQKKEYHALTISFYGIMNYDAFVKTGDSTYYRNVINQYNYFSDTSKLIYFDNGQTVGLPYRYKYKTLNPPWFSGMTQGVAASFLFRYYTLTGDKAALKLAEKTIRFLLKPESEGGTIGRSKEGGPWIEEYPKYNSSKSVLNGFINGLIGLKEYCDFFPGDTYAKTIHDSCYREMIENIYKYDTPQWTTYNRSGSEISNSYMRYQLEEFDHLYSIYLDDRLRKQMKIWSRFAVGKYDKDLHFLLNTRYDFARQIPYDSLIKGFIGDFTSYFLGGFTELHAEKVKKKYHYDFRQKSNYAVLSLKNGTKINSSAIKAFSHKIAVDLEIDQKDSSLIIQSKVPFDHLEIKMRKKLSSSISIKAYDYKKGVLPQFAFFSLMGVQHLENGQKLIFKKDALNLTNAVVFYRFSDKKTDLTKKLFRHTQSFNFEDSEWQAPQKGYYEFYVSFDLTHPQCHLKDFDFQIK